MVTLPAGALRLKEGRAVLEALTFEPKSRFPVLLVRVVLPANQTELFNVIFPEAVTPNAPNPLVPVPIPHWNSTFPVGASMVRLLFPLLTSFRVDANRTLPLPLVMLVAPSSQVPALKVTSPIDEIVSAPGAPLVPEPIAPWKVTVPAFTCKVCAPAVAS